MEKKEKSEDWKKEFRKKFYFEKLEKKFQREIESFFSQTLQSQKEKLIKEIKDEIEKIQTVSVSGQLNHQKYIKDQVLSILNKYI